MSDTARLLARILETAALPLERAVALPGEAFRDPGLAELERTRLLAGEWFALAHVSQIPEPGDRLCARLLGEPVLVVRGVDGVVRTLSRVCQHRGMDLGDGALGSDAAKRSLLRCPYHLWAYGLDGRLRSAPAMGRPPDFATSGIALPAFRTEVFEGFVFATLDAGATPLAARLDGLRERFLAPWNLAEARLVWERRWESRYDWKLLIENFMEPYHHQGSHASTLEPMMPARGCRTEGAAEGWSAVRLPLAPALQRRIRASGPLPGFRPFPRLAPGDHLAWWVFLGYPTFLLFVAPDRAYWYRLCPDGPGRCDLTTTMLVHPDALEADDYPRWHESESRALVAIHEEDVVALEGMQRGAGSRCYAQGRLSPLEEPIWHFQRWLARRIRATGVAVEGSVSRGDALGTDALEGGDADAKVVVGACARVGEATEEA